jgi:hypothetical protein
VFEEARLMGYDLRWPDALVATLIVATWVVLAVVSIRIALRKDPAFRRRLYPRLMFTSWVLCMLLFSTLTVLLSPSWTTLGVLAVLASVFAVLCYTNAKHARVCDRCAAILADPGWSPPEACPHCGAPLRNYLRT